MSTQETLNTFHSELDEATERVARSCNANARVYFAREHQIGSQLETFKCAWRTT
jgi:hypothetical protein